MDDIDRRILAVLQETADLIERNQAERLWNDRLYVTTAVPFGEARQAAARRPRRRNWGPPPNPDQARLHRYVVMAIDRETGETEIVGERVFDPKDVYGE